MTDTKRKSSQNAPEESSRPYRGRRLSWTEFYRLRPDRKPANDNGKAGRAA